MASSRLQHLIPGLIIFGLAAVVTWLSFTQEPAESFLFPRIISIAFIGLAAWNLIRAATGLAKVGRGITSIEAKRILPGLVVAVIYVFFAAKNIGFYVSSFAAFFAVFSIYDSASHAELRNWAKRALVTILFMGVIYGLFAMLLQVQTPRGILF